MHKYNSYTACMAAMEFEAERLKECSTVKLQGTANFVRDKPKAKDGKASNKRKNAPKFSNSGNWGGGVFHFQEEEGSPWKEVEKGRQGNTNVIRVINLVTSLVSTRNRRGYTIVT